MRSRFTRLAAVAAGVVGLLGSYTPPAQAHTVGLAVFVADVDVDGGLGYPIVSGLPTPTGNPLPPNLLINTTNPNQTLLHLTLLDATSHAIGATLQCLPLQPDSILGQFEQATHESWNCHWEFDNRRDVTFSTATLAGQPLCFDVLVNILKGKSPVHQPGCDFLSLPPSYVTGHCGLSGGQVTGRFRDGLGNRITFDIHFRGVGGLLVLSGHWWGLSLPQHGKIYAVAVAVPPTNTPTPIGTPNQTCTDGSARDFLVAGVTALYSDPLL